MNNSTPQHALKPVSIFEIDHNGMSSSIAVSNLVEPLTPREFEVPHLIALGRTNQDIAEQLIVTAGTVKAHAASIYHKLEAPNRIDIVSQGRQLGHLPVRHILRDTSS